MKKIILLASIAVLSLSCTSDSDSDNNSNNNSNSQITPPNWILGTWLIEHEGTEQKLGGYRFTSDNLCIVHIGNIGEICFKETIQLSQPSHGKAIVNQQITDTQYKISIQIGPSIQNFNFQKISETEIKNGSTIYTKQ